jgi:hypothetical protein
MARSDNPFRYFNSSPEVIRLVVMMYVKYRHGPIAVIRRRPEGDRQRRSPGNGPPPQQSSREFSPAIPTKRASDEPLSEDENPPKVHLGPCLSPQPFRPGAPPRQPQNLQRETGRRTGCLAGSHGLRLAGFGRIAPWRRQVAISLTAPPPSLGRCSLNDFSDLRVGFCGIFAPETGM